MNVYDIDNSTPNLDKKIDSLSGQYKELDIKDWLSYVKQEQATKNLKMSLVVDGFPQVI